MKEMWLQFIRELANKIFVSKKRLLSLGIFKSIVLIFEILIFEMALGLLSLPLYVGDDWKKDPDFFNKQGLSYSLYKRRKTVTLSTAASLGIFIFAYIVFTLIAIFVAPASRASITNGSVDTTSRYAWAENIGWIDFGSSQGNVAITDTAITGYAWGEQVGWISLNCSNDSSCATVNYAISNDGIGNLSGYAWGENIGWIDFNPTAGGVTINTDGEFLGYAWNEAAGWIVFNCATTDSCSTVDYKVSTDWRPRTVRPACNNTIDDDGDGNADYPADADCESLTDTSEAAENVPAAIIPVGQFITPPPVVQKPTQPPVAEKVQPPPPAEQQKDTSTGTDESTPESGQSGSNEGSGETSAPTSESGLSTDSSATESAKQVPPAKKLDKALRYGTAVDDVLTLQKFLNDNGYTLAESGPGSPGNETKFFGRRTREALKQYQRAHGLESELGVFGAQTRELISGNPGEVSAPENTPAETGALSFTRSMYRGTQGADVRDLQQLLAQDADVYPEGLTTGYYGALTTKAVQRFQIKHGVVSGPGPGYGVVGPKTREKLAEVYK